jgi:hypothetical protein
MNYTHAKSYVNKTKNIRNDFLSLLILWHISVEYLVNMSRYNLLKQLSTFQLPTRNYIFILSLFKYILSLEGLKEAIPSQTHASGRF